MKLISSDPRFRYDPGGDASSSLPSLSDNESKLQTCMRKALQRELSWSALPIHLIYSLRELELWVSCFSLPVAHVSQLLTSGFCVSQCFAQAE